MNVKSVCWWSLVCTTSIFSMVRHWIASMASAEWAPSLSQRNQIKSSLSSQLLRTFVSKVSTRLPAKICCPLSSKLMLRHRKLVKRTSESTMFQKNHSVIMPRNRSAEIPLTICQMNSTEQLAKSRPALVLRPDSKKARQRQQLAMLWTRLRLISDAHQLWLERRRDVMMLLLVTLILKQFLVRVHLGASIWHIYLKQTKDTRSRPLEKTSLSTTIKSLLRSWSSASCLKRIIISFAVWSTSTKPISVCTSSCHTLLEESCTRFWNQEELLMNRQLSSSSHRSLSVLASYMRKELCTEISSLRTSCWTRMATSRLLTSVWLRCLRRRTSWLTRSAVLLNTMPPSSSMRKAMTKQSIGGHVVS